MSKRHQIFGVAALASLGLVGALVLTGLAARASLTRPANPEAGGAAPELLYQTTGLRDSSLYAVALHCTNVGDSNALITLEIRNNESALDCSISNVTIPPTHTRTLATRDTATFDESAVCDPVPSVAQGSAEVFASPLGSLDVSCTFHVLDAVGSPPVFLYTLDLYDSEGRLLPNSTIFEDGFESGDTSDWS